MTCLNVAQDANNRNANGPQVSQAPTQKLSPSSITAVPFQLPFLYANDYLLTFSLTVPLFIQHIMMQLPHTAKKAESCEGTDNTVRFWGCKNHISPGVYKITFLPFCLSVGLPTLPNDICIFHSSYFTSACRFHPKTPKQSFVLSDTANSPSPKGLA